MSHPAYAPGSMPSMEYGRVLSQEEGRYGVQTAHGRYDARRAKSCLLTPDPGDQVLLCCDELGACYILAVLEGAQEASRLNFQGETELNVARGELRLNAQDISLTSGQCSITAATGRLALEKMHLLAGAVSGQCRSLELAADTCRQSLRSLTQRLGSLFRSTEGHEELQAGSSRSLVQDTRVLCCKNSVLMAEEDARIDAEQIQLG